MIAHTTPICISGVGITSAIGQGKKSFWDNLVSGQSNFSVMQREGRQKDSRFIGAEIADLVYPERFKPSVFRNVSLSGQVAAVTLEEAWSEAKLSELAANRVGLIIGGSNLNQREAMLLYSKYKDEPHFITPTYGFSFMDTDLCGFCGEQFQIQGPCFSVGGASASGQLAIIKAIEAVASGAVDACIALGSLMDVSYYELYALQALGAMGGVYERKPNNVCRPFDQSREGFIYGENCAALVIEKKDRALVRGLTPYAQVVGYHHQSDGNRNPNPSLEGEVGVINQALSHAKLNPSDIDYINPHGTGSQLGDEIELKALQACYLNRAYINTTKSITGHGISAAGAVEVVATLLQMQASMLHPSLNLKEPIEKSFNWVGAEAIAHTIQYALSLSFGFGGINTAVCLKNLT